MAAESRRYGWLWLVLIFAPAFMTPAARAQRGINFDAARIQTVPIDNGFYVLVGEGGNILVSSGDDGILLVDTQYAPMHQKIMDAISKISPLPIRFVINTHDHVDHTGGNELMAKAGAVIVAHENVTKRMTHVAEGAQPNPKDALPVVTYSDSMTLHFNGEDILLHHVAPAHTDNDTVVYFPRANIMHVGDLPSSIRYPRITPGGGPSIDGTIAATDWILKTANSETKIVPGHVGTAVSVKEVREQREMLVIIRDRILNALREGKTLDQVLASKPTAEFDAARKSGAVDPDTFVKGFYQVLASERR